MREIFLRKSRILFAFCSLMLVSCVDPYKCANEIDTNQITVISVISTKPVKFVKAYMGDKVLCEGVNELLYRKNKEDLLSWTMLPMTSWMNLRKSGVVITRIMKKKLFPSWKTPKTTELKTAALPWECPFA